jgi:4-amino-4-deoxy-L-arabinose transferase-like glycosyltransferase
MKSFQRYQHLIISLLGLVVLGSVLGQRLPWHIDEVRFVGVALEMLQNGNWLVPHRAGEIYADKPPIFFWLLAMALKTTDSVRWAFLLPGVISGTLCLLLVHDLGRRWWNARVGICAAILLLSSYQFWRICTSAHIDSFLVLCTTLGIYGFGRHLHSGKDPAWFLTGFFAVSIGILSKGVGFLPLLMFIPFAVLRARGNLQISIPARHWLAGVALMFAILLCWLVPLLLQAGSNQEIKLYLDNILFRQTGKRFANAWQHREPFWFFFAALPKYWAPLSLLLPWLVPVWYRRIRQGDPRYTLLLGWVVLVFAFFSASTGKRELYILPALPATALAAAPIVLALIRKRWLHRVANWAIWILIVTLSVAAVVRLLDLLPESRLATWPASTGWALLAIALLAAIVTVTMRKRTNPIFAPLLSYGLLIIFYHRALVPMLDEGTSGHAAMRTLSESVAPATIALVSWDERNWLYATAPLLHNGIRSDAKANLCSDAPAPALWLMPVEKATALGLQPKNTLSLQRKKKTALVEPTQIQDCTEHLPFRYQFSWDASSLQLLNR